jgi:hypothetical protein
MLTAQRTVFGSKSRANISTGFAKCQTPTEGCQILLAGADRQRLARIAKIVRCYAQDALGLFHYCQ